MATKLPFKLAKEDVVPGLGTVLMVRDMGHYVRVKFTNGVSKLYLRVQRVTL